MNGIEIRSKDSDTWELQGLATTYSSYPVRSRTGKYSEQFMRGAFANALAGREVVELRVEHNHIAPPLAATGRSGTMTLRDTDAGLQLKALLDKSDPDCVAAVSKAKRGLLDRMSVGFVPVDADWNTDRSTCTIRTARLVEVSLCHQPMNPGAVVESVRAQAGRDDLELRYVPLGFTEDSAATVELIPPRYDEFLAELRAIQAGERPHGSPVARPSRYPQLDREYAAIRAEGWELERQLLNRTR